MKRTLGLLILLLAAPSLGAESLRGAYRGEVVPDGPALSLGLDDVVQISLPAATRFTRAVEIEITIPREVFPYRSNLAVFVYQKYSASKATGERVGIEVLPPAGKFYLQGPLVARSGLRAAVDTAVLKITGAESFPLALTILPIDKELPPGYEKFQFPVRVRLLNANLGALVLATSLSDEDRKRLRIMANGVLQPSEGPLLLEPGPYTLEVTLPGVDTVTKTVVVTQGKTTEVPIELEQEDPSVIIEAPEGTQVVLDGKKIAWSPQTPIPVDRGSHAVQFIVGNTVVSDTFLIERGGRHRLTVSLAVSLTAE